MARPNYLAEISVEEYLKKDVDEKTAKSIRAFSDSILKSRGKNSLSFLFATDLHYKSDNELCFGTMKKLREMVMCAELVKPDLFVLNGDITDGHSPKKVILSELDELFDNLNDLNIPIIICKGNHDSAAWFAYETKSADYITLSEWNKIISGVTKRDECGYGYIDFEKHNLRVIYLNTSDIENETDESGRIMSAKCEQWHLGIGKRQINRLLKILETCPDNFRVIFFAHNIPCDELNPKSSVDNGERVWQIIRDFNIKKRVLAFMYGHKHRDSADTVDGITCICTKDMMNACVLAEDNIEYCATLKDIPIICHEPVLNNPKAQILGGWDYIEINDEMFVSKRFAQDELNRSINL